MRIQNCRIPGYPLFVLAIIFTTLAGVWWWASHYNYIPCISDCGETFISQLYARNYRLFGFAYGLVEDHATSPLAAAHPYYYTHNVNLGGLFYTALEIAGIRSFVAKQFCVLLVFGAGLLYTYLAVAYHSRSRFIGLLVLLAACTDFGLFLSFGVHALRVWTWLAIFGLLLHIGRFAYEIHKPKRVDYFGILLFGSIAFGIGYDFWIICLGIAAGTFFFCFPLPLRSSTAIRAFFILFGLLFVPFVLRQIHIATVMGFDYWKTDFFYTFAVKIPFAGLIFHIPSIQEIDQWYQSLNIMRPPSEPTKSLRDLRSSFGQIFVTFSTSITPIVGFLSVLLTFSICGFATVFAFVKRVSKLTGRATATQRAIWTSGRDNTQVDRHSSDQTSAPIDFTRLTNLIAGLSVGMGAGCLVMLKMVMPFYVSMAMPLFGVVFVLCKGAVLGILVKFVVNRWQSLRRIVWWPAFFALLIVVDHAIVQVEDAKAAKPMDTSWIPVVAAKPEATFAVSFIAPVVAGFTKNWAVGIKTGYDRELLKRLNDGKPPFERQDLFWFGERDADARDGAYLNPDYWLYFPIDRRVQFYAVEPECRKDYLSRLLSPFINGVQITDKVIKNSWISPNKLRPGDKAIVGITFKRGFDIQSVKIMHSGNPLATASYNCIHRVAQAEIDPNSVSGTYPLVASVKLAHGLGELNIPLGNIDIDANAPASPPQGLPQPQPTVASILSEYPNLNIVEKRQTPNSWEGFLLIDLRGTYRK